MKYFGACFKLDSDTAKTVIKDKLKKAKKAKDIDKGEVKAIVASVFDENLKNKTENYDKEKFEKEFPKEHLEELKDQAGDIVAEGLQQIVKANNQDEEDESEDNRDGPFRAIPDKNPYCRFWDTYYYELLRDEKYKKEYEQNKDKFIEKAISDLLKVFPEEEKFIGQFEKDRK